MWQQFFANLNRWLDNLIGSKPPVPPVVPPPAPPPPVSPGGPSSAVSEALLTVHNVERGLVSVRSLKWNAQLEAAAQKFAERMARLGQMSHTAGGDTFSQRIAAEGYQGRTGGENIAMGYPDVPAVMNGWMHSAGHKANILNGNFTEVGFGVFRDSQGRRWWCADFAIPGSTSRTVTVVLPGELRGPDA